ncbi:MAG: SMP-30/gluconolactonase/LRE family protein [Bacteroidales bacterium]|nr:SMP-30/gluconolactonase/LRE family protein [Bacteroidales bacterium]
MRFLFFTFILSMTVACTTKQNTSDENSSEAKKTDLFLASDFTEPGEFTSGIEGPAFHSDGMLYLVSFGADGTIGKVDQEGNASLFVNLPEGSTGNGIRFHSDGSMLIADYTGHNVLRIDMETKEISIYAHNENMNQPNDLAISSSNILFLSDPDWTNNTGNLWKVDLGGNIILLEENMGTTNGVEVSPDDNVLYVNESVQRKIWVYDLSPEGNISNKRLFYEFEDFGLDGMRCDKKGNLYVTRHGKGNVVILSPEGKLLNEVLMTGSKPSNIAFGSKDGKTCFITLQDRGCVETFETNIAGREW